MNGASIRNIKRNISEAATGLRCNRYGVYRSKLFKFDSNRRALITSYVAGLFKVGEYLNHAAHKKDLQRAINMERNA